MKGYVGVDVGLQESDFSLRVTFIQRYLQRKRQVRRQGHRRPAAVVHQGRRRPPHDSLTLLLPTVANTSGSPSLLCQLNWTPNSGWPWSSCRNHDVSVNQRTKRGRVTPLFAACWTVSLTARTASGLTLRLLTHLKEYLHFFDFHLPLPQLFLPGALDVFVGVSGRSALVPLSTLTASSWKHKMWTCF